VEGLAEQQYALPLTIRSPIRVGGYARRLDQRRTREQLMTKPLEAANRPCLVVATPDDQVVSHNRIERTQAVLRADG
jgi:hypothetical protein